MFSKSSSLMCGYQRYSVAPPVDAASKIGAVTAAVCEQHQTFRQIATAAF